eukprot:PhF_6_TR24272/c0_g1_i1/m.33724
MADKIFEQFAKEERLEDEKTSTTTKEPKRRKTATALQPAKTSESSSFGPSPDMITASVSVLKKAFLSAGWSTTFEDKPVDTYAEGLQRELYLVFPPVPNSCGFSPAYLSQIKAIVANASGVLEHIKRGTPLHEIASMPKTDLATAKVRDEHNRLNETLLNRKVDNDGTRCSVCGLLKRSMLNVNMMSLEGNNQWTNTFEEGQMCTC